MRRFSNRIEIISTGGLPQDFTKEEFFRGISRPVNAKLQKIFGQLGFVEQTGHGIPLILNHYGRQAFEFMDNFLNVTLPFNPALLRDKSVKNKIRKAEKEVAFKLSESQQALAAYFKKNPGSTAEDAADVLGFSVGYIRKMIAQLKEKKVLERDGSKKNGRWNIHKS